MQLHFSGPHLCELNIRYIFFVLCFKQKTIHHRALGSLSPYVRVAACLFYFRGRLL